MSNQTQRSFAAFLTGAVVLAVLSASIDASWTVWSQANRLFDGHLLWSTVAAHVLLAGLGALVLYPVLGPLLAWRAMSRPFRAGFGVAAGGFLAVFGPFLYVVDLVGNRSGLGHLVEPRILVTVVLLIALGCVVGWLLAGGRKQSTVKERGPLAFSLVVIVISVAGWLSIHALRSKPLHAPPRRLNDAVAASGIRNVLWIVLDTTRRDRMTVYDPSLETTPRLAALAKEGVVFDNASSAASFTLSSHATMLTGRHPSSHGSTHSTLFFRPGNPSLAVELRDAGLRTAAFVSNHVLRIETGITGGFGMYDDIVDPQLCYTSIWQLVHNVQATLSIWFRALRNNGQPHWFENHQRSAAEQNERIFAWLDENDDTPFFLFVNYYDAHWPYLPEPEYKERFAIPYDGPITGYAERGDDFDRSRGVGGYTEEDARYLLSLYDAELAYLDHHVGALLDKLDALGQLDDTLVVVTADHGEHFGERNMIGHSLLYEPALAVPLILREPKNLVGGQRVADPVQAADVAPTVLDLLGLPVPDLVDGKSLLPRIPQFAHDASGTPPPTDSPVIAEDNYFLDASTKMARIGALKLLVGFGEREGEEELYDLAADPAEEHNLLAPGATVSEEHRATLDALRAAIAALPELRTDGPANPKMRAALEALGYAE